MVESSEITETVEHGEIAPAREINMSEFLQLGTNPEVLLDESFTLAVESEPFGLPELQTWQRFPREISLVESGGVYTVFVGDERAVDMGDATLKFNSAVQIHNHPSGEERPSPGDFFNLDDNSPETVSLILSASGVTVFRRPERGWARDMFGDFLEGKGYSIVGALGELRATSELTPAEKSRFCMEFGIEAGIITEQIPWSSADRMQDVLDLVNLKPDSSARFAPPKKISSEPIPEELTVTAEPEFKWIE